ncbi:mini-ribonuclease 3 [Oxobacter pfennigii]|uniref:Mini-ribonuclease 3 n=1 Tax=Oxobacter pfennigii TaxID=36849 RepID=A0A0P8YSJ7_9CLOT|nr:Mini-ribonuclease 3 [Oxobacter pfennigii]KPU42652.1 mini-ribonuclease 3 [Oxobacter pfennigii]
MTEEIIKAIREADDVMDIRDVAALNPLVLAYIGDAVYEVYVRTHIILKEPQKSVHKLHTMSINYVKAHAQWEMVHKLKGILTEEEQNIVRRGRNSKSGGVPKNADVVEYREATGFEALIGYLYLSGNIKRLEEIIKYCISE